VARPASHGVLHGVLMGEGCTRSGTLYTNFVTAVLYSRKFLAGRYLDDTAERSAGCSVLSSNDREAGRMREFRQL